ncbi:hypothetical protein [Blastopirellula marina]|uniref:hypothetical protein n=1 Tax=Blastopirellula marina TaxID=124 RepID=UPI0011B0AE18|nr:hypothetical protein [Blastopirellula marina]
MNALLSAVELSQRVRQLGLADHIRKCVAYLQQSTETFDLGEPGSRLELLQIYRRRERLAPRLGVFVAGGAALVDALQNSNAETIHVFHIKGPDVSAYIFLENLPEKNCIGCIERSDR